MNQFFGRMLLRSLHPAVKRVEFSRLYSKHGECVPNLRCHVNRGCRDGDRFYVVYDFHFVGFLSDTSCSFLHGGGQSEVLTESVHVAGNGFIQEYVIQYISNFEEPA